MKAVNAANAISVFLNVSVIPAVPLESVVATAGKITAGLKGAPAERTTRNAIHCYVKTASPGQIAVTIRFYKDGERRYEWEDQR